ncbi:hypothetical protein C2G38_903097 [Gigaspora rosea]|uniref:Uncharacterized protein n=1 Tax=Gigaspora rosea TaxID=44941 RepID=A0A397VML7_9GLOM|nr:hypothetical protein C2G38_903097 [Gigaspora rosea]
MFSIIFRITKLFVIFGNSFRFAGISDLICTSLDKYYDKILLSFFPRQNRDFFVS